MSGLKEAMNAVRENPKHAGSWVALGEILLAEHQLDKATQSFQRALQLEPTNSAAQRGLAQILLAGNGGGTTAPARPAPSAQASPTSRPATPSQASPAPRPTTPQTSPRTQTQPRAERPVAAPPRTQSPPLTRDTQMARPQRGVAAPMELRTPPPRPRLPSPGRVQLGLFFLFFIPLLCACVAVFALIRIF